MKKFIIVQTVQTDDDDYDYSRPYRYRPLNTTGYYKLDLETGDVSTLPRTVQLQEQGKMSTMVALGSKLYIFASRPLINNSDDDGDHHHSTKPPINSISYLLDLMPDDSRSKLSSPSPSVSSWKELSSPLTRDGEMPSGGAFAFAGKMYLFRNTDSSCFCEVFDPNEEPRPQWRRIKSTPIPTPFAANNKLDPTIGTGVGPPLLADHKNNRIIVYLGNLSSLFAYYPFEDRWECLVECFLLEGLRRWFSYPEPVTIVDGVIYVHRPKLRCIFMAFDIATQQWLKVSVGSDDDDGAVHPYKFYLPIYFYDSLLHLGKDVLCLLASRYKDPLEIQTSTLVHVVQFKVKLINNTNGTKEVTVTPLSSRSRYYDLHSRCVLHHSAAL